MDEKKGKKPVLLLDLVKNLVKQAKEANAGKITATFHECVQLDGWTYGVTVQAPDFEPDEGDWKL